MYRVSRLLLSRHTKRHPTLPRAVSPSDSSRTMQAIKCGWARQTFALAAKSNDKVEKKSGVRLSKKDRRVMVESFIKAYQKLNNGSFPSIHVTHKEVGGSYYIVREIVRDIIQENKVLAPPKVLQKDHKMFNAPPGDYPFGIISMESQVSSSALPNGVLESDQGAATEELILESEKLTDENIDDNLYIGLKAPTEKLEVPGQKDLEVTELLARGLDDSKEIKLMETVELEEPSVGIISDISEAVEVETFLVQDSVKLSESQDAIDISSTSETAPDQAVLDSVSPIIGGVDQNAVLSENENTIDQHVLKKTSQKSSVILNSLRSKGGIGADVKVRKGEKVTISHSSVATDEVEQCQEHAASESAVSSSSLAIKNLNGTSSASVMESNKQEATMAKHEAFHSTKNGKDDPIVRSSEQEATKTKDEAVQGKNKPTLDRVNLESWEEISKKPKNEGNPFAGFVKAFVTAFSKLFSK